MALAIFFITLAGLSATVGSFLLGHRIGKGTEITRKRELREIRSQIRQIETIALDNPDGFVLSSQIFRITRTETKG